MTSFILTGVVAGLASALLFSTIITGSPIAVVLFYLAGLPLLITGLGWGWLAAAVGALIGAVAVAVASSGVGGLIFLASVGAPAVWLTYIALLSRADEDGTVEWYPASRIILWICGIACILVTVGVIAFSAGSASFYAAMAPALRTVLADLAEASGDITDEDLERLITAMITILPPMSAVIWVLVTVFNLFIAGLIVRSSGRLDRPWPDLKTIAYPRPVSLVLVAALFGSFLSGTVAIISAVVAATLILAQTFVGLAVIHVMTRNQNARTLVLATVYLSILLLGWPAFFIAILGMLEPVLNLRARQQSAGPPNPPAPRPPPD